MEHSATYKILENLEISKGLQKENVDKIVDLCQAEEYETGEYVFHQGDYGEHLYIIVCLPGKIHGSRDAEG